jgi:hypothetical protein
MKSLWRHFHDVWALHRNVYPFTEKDVMQAALCAVIFNASGYLHELLKQEEKVPPPAEDAVDFDACELFMSAPPPSHGWPE